MTIIAIWIPIYASHGFPIVVLGWKLLMPPTTIIIPLASKDTMGKTC